ncbi:MAG: osmotically inducible protein C [Planctomycetes bacterium GWF2_42_9]|nr:MAG: osmotically inducible protein C [Planctomycetes bacterium GWF2_42_9]HAL45371.1 osmotically inducible protein C [Phycisphaerales bacterium]
MTEQSTKNINGIPMDILEDTIENIKQQPALAQSRFYITNKWINGGQNQTSITSFYTANEENFHKQTFTLNSDEPEILAGNDTAPNPVEHLLNALAGCVTSSIVYHAAVNGVNIYAVESEIEGEIDLRGFTGLSKDVRKGFQNITMNFRIKSDAESVDQLKSFASFSPVFDVVTNGTIVNININQ